MWKAALAAFQTPNKVAGPNLELTPRFFPKVGNSQSESGEFFFRFWGILIDKTQT